MTTHARGVATAATIGRRGRGVTIIPLAAITLFAAIAGGLIFGKLPRADFAQNLARGAIARVAADLHALDARWRKSREAGKVHRGLTHGSVECISDYDPYWEGREIADRIEAGQRVIVGCLQIRIARE